MFRTAQPSSSFQMPTLGTALQRAFQINRWLTLYGLLSVALTIVVFGLAFVDQRLVTGAPVWFKPLKFAMSLAINAFTLLWLLHFVQGRRRWVALAANLTAIGSLVEIVIIVGQAARGVASHFNVVTPLDGLLFSIMGLFVNFLWVAMLIVAILLMFQRFQQPAFAWALRLGLVVTLYGAIVPGMLMVSATAAVHDPATGQMIAAGAHSVGVLDGGPGLPILGWSTVGGDLRVAHFFGLHAIQFLAVVGGVLGSRRWGWLRNGHRLGLVLTAALGYAGFVSILIWQALRAESLIYPGPFTLLALAALIATVAVSSGGIVWHARATGGLRE